MPIKIHTEIKPLKDKYFYFINGEMNGPYNTWFDANNCLRSKVSTMCNIHNKERAINTALNKMKQDGIIYPRNQEREVEREITEYYKNLQE